MTITNHLGTGALISMTIANPLLAVPMAIVSHFVLDAVPHFGYKVDGGYGYLFKQKLGWSVTLIDIVLALALAALLLYISPWALLIGLIALSPDIMWPIRYFLYERHGLKPPGGMLTRFHWKIQKFERPWGLGVEGVYLLVLVYFVTKQLGVA